MTGSGALACAASHSFDIARQGYVSLLDGRSSGLRSDTADMVAARRRVHGAGIFGPVQTAICTVISESVARSGVGGTGTILDAGAGTGDYLAAVLRAVPTARGIGIDLSKYCARAISRSNERAAAVVADIWRDIPIVDDGVDVVCSVFSPRNLGEFARILAPGGLIVAVTPQPGHLAEIGAPMGMLGIDAGKDDRLRDDLSNHAEVVEQRPIEYRVELDAQQVCDIVAMGPNAFHQSQVQIAGRAEELAARSGGVVSVTISVSLTLARR